jgi:hypothetical protein
VPQSFLARRNTPTMEKITMSPSCVKIPPCARSPNVASVNGSRHGSLGGAMQVMQTPDFAQLGPPALEPRDLLFLFEHFPAPGVDAVEAARRVHEHWNTIDSLLESDYVFEALSDRRIAWLEVSPRLFFNVLSCPPFFVFQGPMGSIET